MLEKLGSTYINLLDIILLHLPDIILANQDHHAFVAVPDEQMLVQLQKLLPQSLMLLQLKLLYKLMFLQTHLTLLFKLTPVLPLPCNLLLHKLVPELKMLNTPIMFQMYSALMACTNPQLYKLCPLSMVMVMCPTHQSPS